MRGLFFNAQPTTDIVAHPSGYDREYDSDDFNRYMGVFFSNGVFVRNDPEACKVTASGLALAVAPGIALVDGGQCHFEPGDGVTITQGDGLYSVMCRRNNAAAVRAFELVVVRGEEEYPAPVREGDLYDLCLAHVQVEDGVATVTDTREDRELCGFAALTGQPPYYPPDEANLPYILWLYVLGLPMTPEQVEAVEGNPSLMEIFYNSRLVPATTEEAEAGTDDSKIMTPKRTKEAVGKAAGNQFDVGGLLLLPSAYKESIINALPCTGGYYNPSAFPELYGRVGRFYGAAMIDPTVTRINNMTNNVNCVDPITGNYYVGDTTGTVSVYAPSGSLIRASKPISTALIIDAISAYNNVVGVWAQIDTAPNSRPAVSKDAGLTWATTETVKMANAARGSAVAIIGYRVYFTTSYAVNGYQDAGRGYYDINLNTWARQDYGASGSGNSGRWLVRGPDLSGFFGCGAKLFRTLDSGVTWMEIGSGTSGISDRGLGSLVGGHLYYGHPSVQKIRRLNITTLAAEDIDIQCYSFVGAFEDGTDVLLSVSATQTPANDMKLYGLISGDASRAYPIEYPGYSPKYGVKHSHIDAGVLHLYDGSNTKIMAINGMSFKAPTITIPDTAVYIRTKGNRG